MTQTSSPWPDTAEGAVSLTFDDGMSSQYDLAVPLLNKHELNATFYVVARDDYAERLAPWRAVAAAGHELGNHTVNHPCAHNNWTTYDPARRVLEEMTLDEVEWEIAEASRRLQELVPDQKHTSFAYPCYQSFVGMGTERQSFVPVVARHCIAGRGLGGGSTSANDPKRCDLAYLWSIKAERMSGAELIGWVERAMMQGRWCILTFHGVHEGHLSVSEGDLAELCTFLSSQRRRIWTAPVATIAQRIREWRATI